jgi:hypothetical protein
MGVLNEKRCKREYEMNIVMPACFYSIMDARILTAYTVAEVELP